MTCPHCDGRPLPYLMQGRWELDPDGTNPALYITDPKGGDPLIVASIKRIHRPDILEGLGLPHKLPPPPDFEEVASAEIKRLREALEACIEFADGIADQYGIDMDETAFVIRVMPEGREIGRRSWASVQDAARAAVRSTEAPQ